MSPSRTSVPVWRKSARSGNTGQCVEIAAVPGGNAVRDSKNPAGPMLTFTASEWRSFTLRAKSGEHDL